MGLGRRPLTRDLYDKLLIAYRDQPGNHTEAARRALCTRQFAKRVYAGPPYPVYPWAVPIEIVLREEAEAARAQARTLAQRQAEEAEAVREKARTEAIEAQAQERQMLKAARGDVLAALLVAAEIVPAMRSVAKSIAKACEPKADGSPPDIPPQIAMQLLTRHATLIQKAVGAAEAVIQLSRLDRGASTVNVAPALADDLSLDQALEELEALEETLGAARARGLALPAKV